MNATHMRREIEEIPGAVARLLADGREALDEAGRLVAEADPSVVVTVARGSSDHAASLLKYAIELTAGVPVASLGPSIASVYGARLKLGRAVALAVSQSGASPDIVMMASAARRDGALTLALTNTPYSPLAVAANLGIDIMAGPERSVAATKSFVTSAVAGLAILAHWTNDERLKAALDRLPAALEGAISCDWSALGDGVGDGPSLFILGRGPALAMANEAALKFKETCGLHAEAYSAAEVMHGPLALVDKGFPVLALAADDAARASTVEAAEKLAARGASVHLAGGPARGSVRALPFASTGHPLTDPLALIVSFYGFVEAFARARGLDPDRPRNLRKVTETR